MSENSRSEPVTSAGIAGLELLLGVFQVSGPPGHFEKRAAHALSEIFGAESCAIFSVSQSSDSLTHIAQYPTILGHPNVSLVSVSPQINAWISRTRLDGPVPETPIHIDSEPCESGPSLCIPIIGRTQLRAMAVVSKPPHSQFSQGDQSIGEICKSILGAASEVVDNTKDGHVRENLISFLRTIAELDPNDIDNSFLKLLDALVKFIPAKFASIWLYSQLDEALILRAFHPAVLDGEKIVSASFDSAVLRLNQSLSYEAVIRKTHVLSRGCIVNPQNANRSFSKTHNLDWFYTFPILGHDQEVYGVINLFPFGESDELGPETLDATKLLITQIAVTMELSLAKRSTNAVSAYDEAFRQMLELGDKQECWDSIALITAREVRCEACSIFFADAQGKLALKGTTGLVGSPPHASVVYRPGEGLTGTVFQQNEPIVYYRELSDKFVGIHKSLFREVVSTDGKSQSVVLVPIRDMRGNAAGVIRCNNKYQTSRTVAGHFATEDVELLQTIGDISYNTYWRTVWLLDKEKAHSRNLDRIHHEVIHPLEAVLTHIEWLKSTIQKYAVMDDEVRHRVGRRSEDVIEAARVIESIVRGLGYARRTDLRARKTIGIRAMLLTTRSWLSSEAQTRAVRIIVDAEGTLDVNGDSAVLHRVFYNLVFNALKYSDGTEPGKYIRLHSYRHRGFVIVDAIDNGVGVDASDDDQVFDDGYRGENAERLYPDGTGQGLFLSRKIVLAHGGTIQIAKRSKPTVVRVKLPDVGAVLNG